MKWHLPKGLLENKFLQIELAKSPPPHLHSARDVFYDSFLTVTRFDNSDETSELPWAKLMNGHLET